MKNRLRVLTRPFAILVVFFCFSQAILAQCPGATGCPSGQCVECFQLDNVISNVEADPGTCFASVELDPNTGIHFPDVMIDPTMGAAGSTIVGVTICNISDDLGTIYISPYSYSVEVGRRLTIDLVVTSDSGDCEELNFNIDVLDQETPAIVGPDFEQYSCIEDMIAATPAAVETAITATDNCTSEGNIVITYVQSPIPNQCPGGNFTRTWTVTDEYNNTSTHTQTIVIEGDVTGPVITGTLANVGPVCSIATETAATSVADLTALGLSITDACSTTLTVSHNDVASGTGCPTTYTRTYTITDECNNSSITSHTITVNDVDDPTLIGSPTNGNADCATGSGSAAQQFADWVNNITANPTTYASDNCPAGITVQVINNANNADITADPFAAMTTPCPSDMSVTFRFVDACGNSVDSSPVLYGVMDDSAPDIMPGADDTVVNCDGNDNQTDLSAWLANNGGSAGTDDCSDDSLIEITYMVDGMTVDAAGVLAALQTSLATGCQDNTTVGNNMVLDNVLGMVTVQFTYYDPCADRQNDTEATFAVVDDVLPIIVEEAVNQSAECDGAGNMTELTAWLDLNGGATATDGCSAVTFGTPVLMTTTTAECANETIATYQFTASDACGNSVTTTANFTILDTAAPTITGTPVDITIECGDTVPGNDAAVSATDVCVGTVTPTYAQTFTASTTCPNTGVYTNTWTADDGCGNVSTSSQTVTVVDTTIPVFAGVPAGITISCDATPPLPSAYTVTASDICQGDITADIMSSQGIMDAGACEGEGRIINTWRIEDACGNVEFATQEILLEDNTDPTFDTPPSNMLVECDGLGNTIALQAWLINHAGAVTSDNCSSVANITITSAETSDTDQMCVNGLVQTLEYTFTATDDCGNTATATAEFSIEDSTAPVFGNVPGDINVNCGNSVPDNMTYNVTASDACQGDVTADITFAQTFVADATCPNTGVYTNTWTVSDGCGNSNAVSQIVTTQDITSPEIITSSSYETEECGGGDDQANLNAWLMNNGNGLAMDVCNDITWSFTYTTNDDPSVTGMATQDAMGNWNAADFPTITPNTCDWSVNILFTITDACGNPSDTDGRFTLIDTTDPVLAGIPADETVECDAIPAPAMPSATDNCDAMVDIAFNEVSVAGTCTDNYILTRTWTASDDCGNTMIGTQVITVEDTTNPTFTVPTAVTLNCEDSQDPTNTGEVTDAVDNCDMDVNVTFADVSTQGADPEMCDFYTYSITRTWTATDNCENSVSQDQVITVQDITDPVLANVPVDVTIECNVLPAPGAPSATDNCDLNPSIALSEVSTQGNNPANCNFYNYTITRTWTATDACGNDDVATQVITVQDTTDPVLSTMPADITVECGAALITTATVVAVADNCDANPDLVYNENIVGAPACPSYTITRTWTATDACGNDITHTQTITVEDTTAPDFDTCPSDVTITTSMGTDAVTGNCDADFEFAYPIISDNCAVANAGCGGPFVATTMLASAIVGDESTIVNDATIAITVPGPLTVATTQVNLVITADMLDGELPTEFFFVTSEDGTALGNTSPTTAQCNAATETIFTTTLAPAVFNQWALDGVVEFTLTANDPGAGSGESAINDICPNGAGGGTTLTGTLMYDCETPNAGGTITYAINGGTAIPMTMPPSVTENFELGVNTVVFTATDCAGNSNTCSFTVTLEDDEAPMFVDCPAIVLVDATAEDCDPNDYELVRPSDATDNCEIADYNERLSQPILFTEHPNIDGYAANDDVFTFTMTTPPPPLGTASLTITLTGDVNDIDEYYSVIDELGNTYDIGGANGAVLSGTCPYTYERTVSIAAADLITMASDGIIVFQTMAHGGVPVMASNDGNWSNEDNGINPVDCPALNATFVDLNTPGQVATGDGVSDITMSLVYTATVVSYTVSGETTIAQTAFPADGSNAIVTLDPGSNTITYYVSDAAGNVGTCEQTVTVGNSSIAAPTIAINSNPGIPSCPGDFVVLDASGYSFDPADPPTWTWYLDNAPLGSDAAGEDMIVATTTVPSLTFQALAGTNNYYAVITDNFCFSSESNVVSINGGLAPVVPQIFASPSPVCSGDDFGLFVANPNPFWVSYEWEGSNGYNYSGQFPPIVTSAANTSTTNNILTYILTVTNSSGCTASASTQVEVRPLPETPTVQTNSPVCDGDDLVLSSSTTCDSYIWIGPDGASTSTLMNPLLQTQESMTSIPADNSAYDGGIWSVICVDENGCQATSETVEVVISQPIAAAPSNDGPACEGEAINLSVGTVTDAVAYSWTGPNGFTSTNQNPSIASPTVADAGTYTVLVTDSNGCTGSGTTEIMINNNPVITAISVNPDAGSCVAGDANIVLSPSEDDGDGMTGDTGGPYTYTWTGPNGFNSTNQNAVIPNGTSADNGSYTLVITNAVGCASAAFTVLVDVVDIPNTPTLTLNGTTFCEGDDLTLSTQGYNGTVSYEWFVGTTALETTTVASYSLMDVAATNSGNYSVVVTVDGCVSNASQAIPVTVNPIPNIPVVSGPDAVCEGEAIQLSTAFVAGATYVWTGPNGFSASVYNPSVSPATAIDAGAYAVQITIDGCPSAFSTPFDVAINNAPNTPTVTNNSPICIDDPMAVLTLSVSAGTATLGATYDWYDAQTNNLLGSSGSSPNFNITDFSNYGDGVFDFYAIASNEGCSSGLSAVTTVVLNAVPENVIAFAGEDQVICDGLAVTLEADAPVLGTGFWTQVSGPAVTIVNPTVPNSSVTGLATGSAYTFRWTLSNGACGDYTSDDVEVVVNSANQTAEAGNKITICDMGSATLAAVPSSSGNIGTWSQSATQSQLGIVITDVNDPNTTVTNLVGGNTYVFTWTLSNNACGDFSNDIVEVAVENNQVNAAAGIDFTACGDGSASIFAQPVTGCTGTWSSPNTELVFADNNAAGTVVMDLQVGENILIWTVDCGACGTNSDMIVITYEDGSVSTPDVVNTPFQETADIDFLSNDLLPEQYTVTIIDQPSYGVVGSNSAGVWSYAHDHFDATPDQFTYQVCNTNCPDICSEITTVSVIVSVSEDCMVPTIITPNNDNVNDALVIECLFATGKYPNNTVAIYNQWGDEVFRATPYENNWEGTYNGEDLPVGTYFYYVELGDGSAAMTGFLVIER